MKLYDTKIAPNGRRLRLFLAEKGIEIERVELDLRAGDNLKPEFQALNPVGTIPVLELDDGTVLTESVSLMRYFEDIQPEPNLMGSTPVERAQIDMWHRRVDFNWMANVAGFFRNTTGIFKDRERVSKEWGEISKERAQKYLKVFTDQLAKNEYLAGAKYSAADISFVCCVDFAKMVGLEADFEQADLARWYKTVTARAAYGKL